MHHDRRIVVDVLELCFTERLALLCPALRLATYVGSPNSLHYLVLSLM